MIDRRTLHLEWFNSFFIIDAFGLYFGFLNVTKIFISVIKFKKNKIETTLFCLKQ